jgi:hypothetical protein
MFMLRCHGSGTESAFGMAPKPNELFHIALRVLSRLTARPPEEPDPADVEYLRQSASSKERGLQLDSMACKVIERELKRRNASRETE